MELNAVLSVVLNAELGECGARMWNCMAFNNMGLAWPRLGQALLSWHFEYRDFVNCHLPRAFVFLQHLHGHIMPIIGQASIRIVAIQGTLASATAILLFSTQINAANSRRKREWHLSFSWLRHLFAASPGNYLMCG